MSLIPDLPSGPLDLYRKKSKFDWKRLKLVFEEDQWKIKMNIWKILKKEPLFQDTLAELSSNEARRKANLQMRKIQSLVVLPPNIIKEMTCKDRAIFFMILDQALSSFLPDVFVKFAVGISLFQNAVSTLGTERHKHIVDAVLNKQILAAIGLTEIAHGSDAKNMRTTATYDKKTKEFVINTPDFQAAKCWSGNLASSCTVVILFAQLYIDGQNYGLHGFIVPVRDPKTLLPYQGVEIGDMGEKIGLNGIDNGFILFNNYRIPREYLLNRIADVTPDGEYESSFSDPKQILGAALENLSAGRVGILQGNINHLIVAITIAVRYAAVRKQFGTEKEEFPILEYGLHQWRLFPYVAAAAVLRIFSLTLTENYLNAVEKSQNSTVTFEILKDEISELHAIISCAKPMITWTCRDAIQECREACGGHGYLKAARFGVLKEANDPCCTYEGDNNILVQQTSNWLIRQWKEVQKGANTQSPLGTCTFLGEHRVILSRNLTALDDVQNINFIMESYQWLITYLVKETAEKQNQLMEKYQCTFKARNDSQVYKAAVLSKIYFEYVALRDYWERVHRAKVDVTLLPVLENLGILFGLHNLEKHLVLFYQGEYTYEGRLAKLVQEGIIEKCALLKDDMVSITDALAPPDFIINSVLGRSDGELYKHLEEVCRKNPTDRPDWWKEINFENAPNLKSKL